MVGNEDNKSVDEKVDMETLHKTLEITEGHIQWNGRIYLSHYLQLLGVDEDLFNEKRQLLKDGYESESGIKGILELLGLPIHFKRDIVVDGVSRVYHRYNSFSNEEPFDGAPPSVSTKKCVFKKYSLRSVFHIPLITDHKYPDYPDNSIIAVTIDDKLFYDDPRTVAHHHGIDIEWSTSTRYDGKGAHIVK